MVMIDRATRRPAPIAEEMLALLRGQTMRG
jgi:acyl-ACP thioesterase